MFAAKEPSRTAILARKSGLILGAFARLFPPGRNSIWIGPKMKIRHAGKIRQMVCLKHFERLGSAVSQLTVLFHKGSSQSSSNISMITEGLVEIQFISQRNFIARLAVYLKIEQAYRMSKNSAVFSL